MFKKLLLPNRFKKLGWVILIPSTIIGAVLMVSEFEALQFHSTVFAIYSDSFLGNGGSHYFQLIKTDVTNTLVGTLFIIGGLLVGFSKEKNEDEYIANLRLNSLLWAVLVNYLLLLFLFIFVYGFVFLNVMVYNMFTILIFFIAIFNISLYRNSKSFPNEE